MLTVGVFSANFGSIKGTGLQAFTPWNGLLWSGAISMESVDGVQNHSQSIENGSVV